MSTPYSVLINQFFKKVEKEQGFFEYLSLSDSESMDVATERALGYLNESIGRIEIECQPSVDFSNRDDTAKVFNFDLTDSEKFIIVSLMFEYHLSRDIAYLKVQSRDYTSTELRVFDPSNARSTFMDMYEKVCNQNIALLEEYRNRNRKDGSFIGIDYSSENADNK